MTDAHCYCKEASRKGGIWGEDISVTEVGHTGNGGGPYGQDMGVQGQVGPGYRKSAVAPQGLKQSW